MGRARGLLGQEEQHLRQGGWWSDTGVPWEAPLTPVLRGAAGGQRSQPVSPLLLPSSWFFPFNLITGKSCFASFARIIWSQVPDFNREGYGTPLQYSCLENPMDGGAWWAAVHGVAKSRTRLKRLSSSTSSSLTLKVMQETCFLSLRKSPTHILPSDVASSVFPWVSGPWRQSWVSPCLTSDVFLRPRNLGRV